MDETMNDVAEAEDSFLSEINELKVKVAQLEAENQFLREQSALIEDLKLTLELANERWVNQVNENTNVTVQLRKLQKVMN